MGLTHEEFFRELPAGPRASPLCRRSRSSQRGSEGGSLVITLGSEQTRSIAALRLPYTVVGFAFEGVEEVERETLSCSASISVFDARAVESTVNARPGQWRDESFAEGLPGYRGCAPGRSSSTWGKRARIPAALGSKCS